MTWEWKRAGRRVELAVRTWAWGFGGGVLTERIQTVCGPRRRVLIALDVLRWQLSLVLEGKCQGRRP